MEEKCSGVWQREDIKQIKSTETGNETVCNQ